MSCAHTRLNRLRDACRSLDPAMQSFYVRDTSNIFWLTTFDDVFDEERAHALIVEVAKEGNVLLHTDSRYVTACERALQNIQDARITVSIERKSHMDVALSLLQKADSGADNAKDAALCMGIEDSIELFEYRALEKSAAHADKPAKLLEAHELVSSLRAVKDAEEITRLQAAQAVSDEAFAYIVDFIRPGMTEREVQVELESFMRCHGASGIAFSSIVATGANGASPHAIAGDTHLEAGQCVVLDFGACVGGYCSDMTRTVFLGSPDATMLSAWETILRANEEVEEILRPGVTGKEAHELAERILDEGGFGGRMGHGLGHGLGIDIHEEPSLSLRNPHELVVGNVVTVEPGIYIPGKFGMRLEDFGVVTEDGFDVFTQTGHDMIVI